MKATEILTSLRSEKPNASSFKAPAVEKLLFVRRGKPDNPDQSAVRKARASSKDQTNGGLGEGGWGSADNPDQSAVREIRHRNRDRPRREKTREREKGTNQEDEKGGESSADNPDQSAVREARHHQGRGSG